METRGRSWLAAARPPGVRLTNCERHRFANPDGYCRECLAGAMAWEADERERRRERDEIAAACRLRDEVRLAFYLLRARRDGER